MDACIYPSVVSVVVSRWFVTTYAPGGHTWSYGLWYDGRTKEPDDRKRRRTMKVLTGSPPFSRYRLDLDSVHEG